MRSAIRLLSLLLTTALALTILLPGERGAQATPRRGGTLRVALTGEPPTLDVHQTGAMLVLNLAWHMEWVPDRHIRMARFDRYAALPGEPNGYGGRKVAWVDEVVLVPSSEPSSRVLGVEAGDFDLGDWIPADAYERLAKLPGIKTLAVKPKEWIVAAFNQTSGRPFARRELRQAAQAAIDSEKVMQAAIGRTEFFRLDPGLVFREQVWHSTAGQALYNQKNPVKARDLLKKAGYAGEEIRWLTTKEYEWMYRASLAGTQQLQEVGLKVKLGVVDWATLLRTRKDYDVFVTGMVVYTDPTQIPVLNCSWVGWYCEERHQAMMKELATTVDFKARKAQFEKIQAHFYDQAAALNFGDVFSLRIHRPNVQGFANMPELFVWNVWKQ